MLKYGPEGKISVGLSTTRWSRNMSQALSLKGPEKKNKHKKKKQERKKKKMMMMMMMIIIIKMKKKKI